ncbi:HEAT repeat domain-containing protein [Flagellimonas allohymeniacidonis]|uniref:HEAT repeat domain-containing protein n=1 Tax=Flagellimonas allohymeniacidonis TaxID=2517819 RepID=A0A4Q8QL34_9FLAO|nr:HEAT repeat domain-containing protein [Allomuricauda hymeniacidonis]TAI49533.1 HEAT repeat domain-containing protein [Allomuricauda hymeniacidonis]
MGFYDLSKDERAQLVQKIDSAILKGLKDGDSKTLLPYFEDSDTYIRKAAYLAIGKVYKAKKVAPLKIISVLKSLMESDSEKVRQTTVNAAGEIGKTDFPLVQTFFERELFDVHHSVRNAVIGSIKKMGEKNPQPVLGWAKTYLHHPNKEIRREICHGIELRGRTHPQDILPLLKELQHDPTARVRNTLIHVLGQIAYKKGCLKTVVNELNHWENKELVEKALDEIVDVHHRYKNFAVLSQEEVMVFIDQHYMKRPD